jgi:hypothetical protein
MSMDDYKAVFDQVCRKPVRLVGPGLEPVDAMLTDAENEWIERLFASRTALCGQIEELRAELEMVRARFAAVRGEADHPVPTPGVPPHPATLAAVQIARCPNCDEFPREWRSGGMECTE